MVFHTSPCLKTILAVDSNGMKANRSSFLNSFIFGISEALLSRVALNMSKVQNFDPWIHVCFYGLISTILACRPQKYSLQYRTDGMESTEDSMPSQRHRE